MNIVDFIILGIIGISLVFGLYKGFINSIFSLLALLLSLFIAYSVYPQVAGMLKDNDNLVNTLVHYSDASSRIHDVDLARTSIETLSQQALDEIITQSGLPAPFDTFVKENVTGRVFASIGSLSISDYLNHTIIDASLNILCFLACFLASYIVLTLLVHLIGYVFTFPVLKHFDMILGGAFGGVRGIFLVFVVFALIPIILTISPIEGLQQMIDEAQFSNFFYKDNFITSIIKGFL